MEIQRRDSRVQRRPIKVLVTSARFFPDLGGTETHIRETTRRLAERSDIEVTILTTDRSGTRPLRETFDGVTVLRCRSYPRRRDYYFAPGIYRGIMSGAYDIIHCQGIHTAVPALAMVAARRKRIPYVVTLHTGGHSSGLRRKLRNTQWRALGPLLRAASAVVAVSRFEQLMFQTLCSLDVSRCRIIQNGGDLPAGAARSTRIPGRIVSSGRLERYKGHQRVIEALPIILRTRPDATLHILGQGPYERDLRTLIKALRLENCVTIETIPPDDRARMARSIGDASVVTSLSQYEAHPIAIMEALTLGIPAVGSDTAGVGDLVADGLVNGVPSNASPTTIARTLLAALDAQPVSVPANLPTWDLVAAELAQVYLDVVRATPTPRRRRGQ
jgi:glycosyltransferase involved in cell wall biosynthesis